MEGEESAVGYIRISQDIADQKRQQTLKEQEDAIVEYAERKKMKLRRIYIDVGLSGLVLDERLGLTTLIDELQEYENVLTTDMDRIGHFPILSIV
jgi:DNA invertase Pin-like site-specific DNA recombinase